MVKPRPTYLWLVCACLLAACSNSKMAVRPITKQTGPSVSQFEEIYAIGRQYFAAGQYGLGVAYFERALAMDGRSVKTLNALGACFDDLHRHDLAMQYYQRALAIEPRNADTFNNIAISLEMAGSRAEAAAMLKKAASLNPSDQTIRKNAAEANLSNQRPTAQAVLGTAPAEDVSDVRGAEIERTSENSYSIVVVPVSGRRDLGVDPRIRSDKSPRNAVVVLRPRNKPIVATGTRVAALMRPQVKSFEGTGTSIDAHRVKVDRLTFPRNRQDEVVSSRHEFIVIKIEKAEPLPALPLAPISAKVLRPLIQSRGPTAFVDDIPDPDGQTKSLTVAQNNVLKM